MTGHGEIIFGGAVGSPSKMARIGQDKVAD